MTPAPTESLKLEPLVSGESAPPIMVHVVAPATLPAGYTFEAQIGGDLEKTFPVTVPQGGVNEGDTFLVPLPDDFALGPIIKAPTGRWKDGLCNFLTYGPCHPHLCCALCCTQLAMGQVMQRLKLTWIGDPGVELATRNTFKIVLILVLSYTVCSTALELIEYPYVEQDNMAEINPLVPFLKSVGSILFTFWSIVALCKTRRSVRAKYSIPEEQCVGCEDLCCAAFCACCSVAQMARHTGEYETYASSCCTSTGLPADAPLAV